MEYCARCGKKLEGKTAMCLECCAGVLKQIFGEDIKFKSLKFLAGREVASIREIARKVGMSPKNLSKYLDYLAGRGAIEVAYRAKNIKLYRISQNAEIYRRLVGSPRAKSGSRNK